MFNGCYSFIAAILFVFFGAGAVFFGVQTSQVESPAPNTDFRQDSVMPTPMVITMQAPTLPASRDAANRPTYLPPAKLLDEADVLLMVDISGSMALENRIDFLREALTQFINTVPDDTRVALGTFNETVTIRTPLDTVAAQERTLRDEIDGLDATGGTALYDAFLAGIDYLRNDSQAGRSQILIVITDGMDTDSEATLRDVTRRVSDLRLNQTSPFVAVPIGFGSDADSRALLDVAILNNLGVPVLQPGNIGALLADIADDLR